MTKRFSSVVAGSFWLAVSTISIGAQNTRNTDYSPDKSLKSNARVNPSTLAMEFSVALGGYPGRAGNSMPVTFDYTSKVWQQRNYGDFMHPSGNMGTTVVPLFAKRTAAGWSSSLGVPSIDYQSNVCYVANGQAYEGEIWNPDTSPYANVYSIKRLYVTLSDGSSHELRTSDTPIYVGQGSCPSAIDLTGTYLAVDGSKMRLEEGTTQSTLYMPDGSRYLFGTYFQEQEYFGRLAATYIDSHGNRTTYNSTNKQWTDTMGRVLANPLPGNYAYQQAQTVGDQNVTLPGMNGAATGATLSWRYLKDPNGGESGLGNPNQNLAYPSQFYCNGGNSFSTVPGTYLFANSDYEFRVCNYGLSYPGATFNPIVLTKITLANGQSYQFKYNLYGEIEKIIYPSGGYERFAYSYIPAMQRSYATYDQTNRGVVDRWVSAKGDGTDEVHWTYAASRGQQYPFNPYQVTMTNPDSTRTEQLLHDEPEIDVQRPYGFDNAKTGRSYEDRVLSPTNQLLRRHLSGYEWTGAQTGGYSGATRDLRPNKEISIIFEPGNSYALASMTETVYDTNSDPQYFAALNAKQTKTYNYIVLDLTTAQTANINQLSALFTNANLATISEIDYLYDANYKARNIIGLVTETRIKDALGNIKARSQIAYDEATYPLIYAGTDTQWQDPNTIYRGDVTTTKSWTDIVANQFVETHGQYDTFGNLRKAWDAKGNVSEVEYNSTYNYAYPTKTISAIPDPSGTTGANQAFETTIVYDFTTGLLLSSTDANGQTSSVEYTDALLRPTKTIAPNGHQTITEYGAGTSAATRFVKVRTQIDQTNWKEGYSWYDGIGRAIKTQSVDSAGDVFTETEYDNMSRPKKTTNPYRTGETKLWTESFYDDLSRVTKIKTPDNAEVLTTYSLATTGANIGTVVTVTDQAGKQRRSIINGLGQLTRVDEPNESNQLGSVDAPAQPTFYGYDTLNNLTQVVQGSQMRSFVYDSLSRLKQATNPEAGMMQYQYDLNGNLQMKTDARGITTTFAYDTLNRVKTRSYSDTTPPVAYFYDNLQNAKGKLIKVSSSISTTEYTAFDILGRVLAHKQTTDGQNYTTGYSYNLSGALIEETYPSGRVVKNVLDNDGDLAIVQSKKNVSSGYFNYAKNFTYTAAGAVSSMQLGNGRWESTSFNSRLQPTQIALGTVQNGTDKLKLNFDYGTTQNNGNVLSQQITVPTVGANQGFIATQNYSYDSLNRLKSAVENIGATQTWKQTFTFDRYGNRNFDTANTTTLGSCPANQCNPTIDTANNRFTTGQGYTFDLSGNVITDATGKSFIYDAENKQKSVTNTSGTIGTYLYDGDGKRVKKVSAQETTIFVYDAAGKLVAEYSNQTSATPQVSYLTSDHLDSPRINTDANGNVIAKHDYQPFGEEIYTAQRTAALGYIADNVREKFATYERDSETGLDFAQARMYGGSHGRFTSPDPTLLSVNGFNPQSWNRYTYVLNNPLKFTDPLGLWELRAIDQTKKKKNKDGTETEVYDRTIVVAVKTKDDDNGASLAKQLGLTGKDATKFADKIGSGDNIQLSEQGGDVGYVFGEVEQGLTDQKKWEIKNADKLDKLAAKKEPQFGPDSNDCSGTSCRIGLRDNVPLIGTNILDPRLDTEARAVNESDARVGDIVRYADKSNVAQHFANFIFRSDDGVPEVFSKSGTNGRYERREAASLQSPITN